MNNTATNRTDVYKRQALGFEGLCWSCRAKHHRGEVNNWSLQEIEEKKKQVIEKLKVTEKDKFFSSDE